jgi:2-polyprenyl-3-methyl-5-hydroxy-6-metoxy-1,4-benzoquinol methylase
MPVEMSSDLRKVYTFWNSGASDACLAATRGGEHGRASEREAYAAYRESRYRTEWQIPAFAGFADARGKRVLEIGCGNGADAVMYAKQGAAYVGVDLSDRAVDSTRRHLALEGLEGRCGLANVEQLCWAKESFDIVYAFGVLHHTSSPEKAVHEMWRVLKPGGVALVMLYHRHSLNYYVRILLYMRLRLLLEIVRRSLRARSAETGEQEKLNGNAADKWAAHYENFRRLGWSYLRARTFAHHCTDGPECPIAFTFTRREVVRLFREFTKLQTCVAHFPVGGIVPRAVERACGSAFGWHLQIRASK